MLTWNWKKNRKRFFAWFNSIFIHYTHLQMHVLQKRKCYHFLDISARSLSQSQNYQYSYSSFVNITNYSILFLVLFYVFFGVGGGGLGWNIKFNIFLFTNRDVVTGTEGCTMLNDFDFLNILCSFTNLIINCTCMYTTRNRRQRKSLAF